MDDHGTAAPSPERTPPRATTALPPAVLYALTVLIWGSTWYAIKFQLGSVHPAVSVAWRYLLAATLLLAYCRLRGLGLRIPAKAHLGVAAMGFFLFSINYILFYFAARHVATGLLAVVFSTIVFMNILNGALLFRARVERRVLAGAGLGLSGIALVFWPELTGAGAGAEAALGLGLGVAATYCASLGNMASVHNQRHGLPVVEANALGMTYGALFTLVAALALGAPLTVEWSAPYLLSLGYLALFGSVFGFGCYLTLLGRIGADRAAYATVLFPVVALAISTAFEGYRWSGPALLGVALILGGNVLVLRAPARA